MVHNYSFIMLVVLISRIFTQFIFNLVFSFALKFVFSTSRKNIGGIFVLRLSVTISHEGGKFEGLYISYLTLFPTCFCWSYFLFSRETLSWMKLVLFERENRDFPVENVCFLSTNAKLDCFQQSRPSRPVLNAKALSTIRQKYQIHPNWYIPVFISIIRMVHTHVLLILCCRIDWSEVDGKCYSELLYQKFPKNYSCHWWQWTYRTDLNKWPF